MRESERRAGRKSKRQKQRETERKGRRERKEEKQAEGGKRKRQVKGVKRQQPKPELGWARALGKELGEQECQAEVQEGHGSHHQGVGSSLERKEKCSLSP